jgi:glutaredoxin
MDQPTVILYTKPGCSICRPVQYVIDQVCRRRPFDFQVRNIEQDPQDFDRYKHDIPVVTLNGREIARHRMSEQDLERALDALGSS